MPLGALVGGAIAAGASLLGGSKQSKNVSKANVQQRKFAQRERRIQAAALRKEARRQDKWSRKNLEMQETFAKEGLRWKVADAKAAGVHPLYALGANTTSFSPVSVGGVGAAGAADYAPSIDSGLPNAMANAGQDIGRAVSAMQTPQERVTAAMGVERLGLENDLLRAQIAATLSRVGTGPGMPAVGGPDIRLFGAKASPSPSWSDAEEFQRRYGEPAEWAVAGPIALADMLHNYGGFAANVNKWKQTIPADQFRYQYFR